MDIWREREAIRRAYPGAKWRDKVDKMAGSQVHAVFMKLKQNGKL